MTDALKKAWDTVIRPIYQRPARVQVAALCTTKRGGMKKVLLITSRDTGRWILPKGWPIDGLDAAGSAAHEAWEEAGVRAAKVGAAPIGQFGYDKILEGGVPVPVETHVFPLEVDELADDYPEASERRRKWVDPVKAAQMVDEPGLREILLDV